MALTYDDYLNLLNHFIKYKKLTAFYPPGSAVLRDIAKSAPPIVAVLKQTLKSDELSQQVFLLSLYDLVIILDDSGSMQWNHGRSIESLRAFLNLVIKISSIYLKDGASICWLNNQRWTKIGESLHYKVLEPLILGLARSGQLAKPTVVMIITDGEPAGEPRDSLKKCILHAQGALNKTRYGETAVDYQIAHVGNHPEAIKFLRELDADPQIGKMIDCTSEEGIERAEALLQSDTDLSPEMWVAKLMLGPLEQYFDEYDEKTK